MDNQAQMAAYFAAVSRDLLARSEEELTFQRIADRAVDVIPPCDFVGHHAAPQARPPRSRGRDRPGGPAL